MAIQSKEDKHRGLMKQRARSVACWGEGEPLSVPATWGVWVSGIMGAPERCGTEVGLPLAGTRASHRGGSEKNVVGAGREGSQRVKTGRLVLEAVCVGNGNSSGIFMGAPLP